MSENNKITLFLHCLDMPKHLTFLFGHNVPPCPCKWGGFKFHEMQLRLDSTENSHCRWVHAIAVIDGWKGEQYVLGSTGQSFGGTSLMKLNLANRALQVLKKCENVHICQYLKSMPYKFLNAQVHSKEPHHDYAQPDFSSTETLLMPFNHIKQSRVTSKQVLPVISSPSLQGSWRK